jgi:hypothetical protein
MDDKTSKITKNNFYQQNEQNKHDGSVSGDNALEIQERLLLTL